MNGAGRVAGFVGLAESEFDAVEAKVVGARFVVAGSFLPDVFVSCLLPPGAFRSRPGVPDC